MVRWMAVAILLFSPMTAEAHGVSGAFAPGGMAVTASYSDGAPMARDRFAKWAPL